jgi:hypothetical protein
MAAPIFIPKRSTVASKVPSTSDLALGEIAINHADQKLYARHPSSGVVQEIGGSAGSAEIYSGTTPPSSGTYSAWINTNSGRFYVFIDSYWVEANGDGNQTICNHTQIGSYFYIGKAPAGTANSSAGWTIKRTETNNAGDAIATLTATGIWNNAASLSYS